MYVCMCKRVCACVFVWQSYFNLYFPHINSQHLYDARCSVYQLKLVCYILKERQLVSLLHSLFVRIKMGPGEPPPQPLYNIHVFDSQGVPFLHQIVLCHLQLKLSKLTSFGIFPSTNFPNFWQSIQILIWNYRCSFVRVEFGFSFLTYCFLGNYY